MQLILKLFNYHLLIYLIKCLCHLLSALICGLRLPHQGTDGVCPIFEGLAIDKFGGANRSLLH